MDGEKRNIGFFERLVCAEYVLPCWSFRIDYEENARTAPPIEEAIESIRQAAELAIERLKEVRQRRLIGKTESSEDSAAGE